MRLLFNAFMLGCGAATADLSKRNDRLVVNHGRETSNVTTTAGDDKDDPGFGTGVATKTRPKTKRPSMYRVLLLNDDYTPMEFVVEVLEVIFKKSHEEAVQIMLHVHQNGVGVCGVYTYEVAETKVAQVLDAARRNQHPLQCTMEKE